MSKRDSSRKKEFARVPPLRWAWSQLMPAATRGSSSHKQRIYWKGIPRDGNDPLRLEGMELCVAWTPDPDNRLREMAASAIAFKEFLAQYPLPGNSRITLFDYAVDLLQVVDPTTEYGRMLAKQRFQGLRDASAGVTIRPLRLRLLVGDAPKATRQLFRQRTKSGRFPHGIDLPQFTVVDPPQCYPDDCVVNDDGSVAADATGTSQALLSDLEVDRLWELAGMVAEWLVDRQGNVAKRVRRKEETQQALLAVRAAEQEPRALVEALTAVRDAAAALEAKRVEELEAVNLKLQEARQEYQRERSIAVSAIRSAENEIRRLKGVYDKEFRLLTEAYRQYGDGSPQHTSAATRTSQAKGKWDAAPAKAEAAKLRLAPIDARWAERERKLSREVQFAESQLGVARREVEKAGAKLGEAEAALKIATDATALAISVADDYVNSI